MFESTSELTVYSDRVRISEIKTATGYEDIEGFILHWWVSENGYDARAIVRCDDGKYRVADLAHLTYLGEIE